MRGVLDKRERKQHVILDTLRGNTSPVSGSRMAEILKSGGYDVSERSVRLYLGELAREGLTRSMGRRGHLITPKGIAELESAHIMERVGLLSAKIDRTTYAMTFDLERRSGTVPVNIAIIDPVKLLSRWEMMAKVFSYGFSMGRLCGLLMPGERVGNLEVPPGQVGFCTVCSITVNGVLLKAGVPMHSRFGGLLEMKNRRPTRFVEIIMYNGTSIDPLEIFIRGGMTDYVGAITSGSGRIGASFREVPAESRGAVADLAQRLDDAGLGSFMQIGPTSQPLLDISVSQGMAGAVLIGGLNPVAILEETGERVLARALAGLLEFERLIPYTEVEPFLRRL